MTPFCSSDLLRFTCPSLQPWLFAKAATNFDFVVSLMKEPNLLFFDAKSAKAILVPTPEARRAEVAQLVYASSKVRHFLSNTILHPSLPFSLIPFLSLSFLLLCLHYPFTRYSTLSFYESWLMYTQLTCFALRTQDNIVKELREDMGRYRYVSLTPECRRS